MPGTCSVCCESGCGFDCLRECLATFDEKSSGLNSSTKSSITLNEDKSVSCPGENIDAHSEEGKEIMCD